MGDEGPLILLLLLKQGCHLDLDGTEVVVVDQYCQGAPRRCCSACLAEAVINDPSTGDSPLWRLENEDWRVSSLRFNERRA